MNKSLKFGLYFAVALALAYGVLRMVAYRYVQPDEIGIWMTNGGYNGVSDYQLWQGSFPVDFTPATRSFVIPAQPWTIDMPKKIIYSRQKGEWDTDPQYTYRADRNQGPLICFRNNSMLRVENDSAFLNAVGKHLLNVVVNDVFNEVIGQSNDSTLIANTFVTQRIIEDSVRARFLRNGYILEAFLSNLNPPQVIILKNRSKNDAEAAALTAKSDVIKAEAEAKVKVATARADAEAMLVSARAQAEAVRLRQVVLTDAVLREMWIDKWDGSLPTYITGAQAGMMLGVPK